MSELVGRARDSVERSTPPDGADGRGRALAGRPVDYRPRDFAPSRSWELLSPTIRSWAETVAGPQIRDPHSGVEQYYWSCDVARQCLPGPNANPHQATYELWVFGKGGLAVAAGTTVELIDEPDATKWRTERWALPIGSTGVRSAHLSAGPPNTITPSTGNSDTMAVEPLARAARFVPAGITSSFGNLPAATQLHLLEPFMRDDRGPQKGDLDATIDVVGDRYEERYTCYLFNARWVAFVAAHRSVPYHSGMNGPELWADSPESAAIRTAPWVVAAWFGPFARPRRGLAAR